LDQRPAQELIVENGMFFGVGALGGADLEDRGRCCALRSDRLKRRTVALRASVSSDRSALAGLVSNLI
jgi:hypothetical protein